MGSLCASLPEQLPFLHADHVQEEIYSSSYAAAAYLEAIDFPKDKKVYVVGEVGIQVRLAVSSVIISGPVCALPSTPAAAAAPPVWAVGWGCCACHRLVRRMWRMGGSRWSAARPAARRSPASLLLTMLRLPWCNCVLLQEELDLRGITPTPHVSPCHYAACSVLMSFFSPSSSQEELDLKGIAHIGGPADADKKVELKPGMLLEQDPDVSNGLAFTAASSFGAGMELPFVQPGLLPDVQPHIF